MKTLIETYMQNRLGGGNKTLSENTVENDDLRHRVELLTIGFQALAEIVETQFGINETAILQKMQEVDGRDGQLDGKATAGATTCPICHRPNSAMSSNCMYCGALLA